MNEIARISKTFIGYLKRPGLYPELRRKILKNTINRRSVFKGKEKPYSWANSNVISQEEAIFKLFGIDRLLFRKDFEDVLRQSLQKEKECPIKMGGPGALELIYYACEFTQSKNAIETGVAYGWSTLASILSLKKRNGTLYSSDLPYLGQDRDQYLVI